MRDLLPFIAGSAAFAVFLFVILPLLFKLKRGYLEKALAKHNAAHDVEIKLIKAGIPPLKYWLRNRKGDCWGLVSLPDGSSKWVRLRSRILSSGSPLTFFDP